MQYLILQNANEGAVSSVFNALLRSIDLILGTEEVRTLLGWIGAMLTVGACILMARFLVSRAVTKANQDKYDQGRFDHDKSDKAQAGQPAQNALDASRAPKS